MSVIDIELAMAHLHAEPEDQALVQMQLDASEDAAMRYLQRRFFVDSATVAAAKAETTLRTRDARGVYAISRAEADLPENSDIRCRLIDQARQALADAYEDIDMDQYSIVINPSVQAACLLKLGHLFANREEVVTGTIATELPLASKSLLAPYRIRMGV